MIAILRALADLAFPRLCLGCGERIVDTTLPWCADCEETLSPVGTNICVVCGCPDPVVRKDGCRQCPVGGIHFDSARGAFHFQGVAREVVERLKYRGHTEHVPAMAKPMIELIIPHTQSDRSVFLIPVPLYSARRRERGFNQSEELCKQLSEWLGIPHLPDAVRRSRATPSQTRLSRRKRRLNMKDAFQLSKSAHLLEGSIAILIDDVYTTGSTLNAVSKILRESGVHQIHAVAFTRAILDK